MPRCWLYPPTAHRLACTCNASLRPARPALACGHTLHPRCTPAPEGPVQVAGEVGVQEVGGGAEGSAQ